MCVSRWRKFEGGCSKWHRALVSVCRDYTVPFGKFRDGSLNSVIVSIDPHAELTKEALQVEAERDDAFGRFLDHMGELLSSQQKHEGENITVGEALDRQEKGASQMRKIIEGDE